MTNETQNFKRTAARSFPKYTILITAVVAASFALEWLLFGSIQMDSLWTIIRGLWFAHVLLMEVLEYLQTLWDFVKWVWSWFVPQKDTDER